MSTQPLTRDAIASMYLDQLPYPPYPVQEEALLTYFTADQGLLVCAPTGTGKTLIAEAALFEALHTGTQAYYTTPLIALTEQKFVEMQAAAVRWGFSADDVGLVTGHRRVNPEAPVLVVVAEILLNRLLHKDAFDFANVSAVVMDEFHSFADHERGIVWELSLGMLPAHVRTLLISATVGNAFEFCQWLRHNHSRSLELVQGTERKVPLNFQWVGDQLLVEQIEKMAEGTEETRYTPALLFCFNREVCWSIAEQLKGKSLIGAAQQKQLADELAAFDLSKGAGPKLKALLQRGVGVHHAGVLPKYRRFVEELFQKKLLSVCVCTETLSAGINLPARSVVLPELLKGPPGDMKLMEASAAHQMFGRAGRPQFDKQGYVFALAHEDDVKIARWREKYDKIPEDTKDPGLLRMKKDLNRKKPIRRQTEQYWHEGQFEQLRKAPAGKLYSRGHMPWRLLAYYLEASPEIEPLRRIVSKRLFEGGKQTGAQKMLDRMLLTLWAAGYVTLEPPPPPKDDPLAAPAPPPAADATSADAQPKSTKPDAVERALLRWEKQGISREQALGEKGMKQLNVKKAVEEAPNTYQPMFAHPTPQLDRLRKIRGINPLYAVYLANQLGIASREERIQAIESVLEIPGSVARLCRVTKYDDMPPGPLATQRLDIELLQLGLATPEQLGAPTEEKEEDKGRPGMFEEKVWPLTLAEKLRLLFDASFPDVHSLRTTPVWAAGEVMVFNGNFEKYITSHGLQKQEGVIFRHLLRMILLLKEFEQITPPDCDAAAWQADLREIADKLTEACHSVDPTSTDKMLEDAKEDELADAPLPAPAAKPDRFAQFGAGL